VNDDGHAGLLDDLMARAAPCFARRETCLTCRRMVNGLLSELDGYTCGTLAEAAGLASPCPMRHLLSRARCDGRAMLDAAGPWAVGRLNEEHSGDRGDAILIVDETSDVKSSADCVGAARRSCGATGSVALCQVAVTLHLRSPGRARPDRPRIVTPAARSARWRRWFAGSAAALASRLNH
jgi:SRSO17 transposase